MNRDEMQQLLGLLAKLDMKDIRDMAKYAMLGMGEKLPEPRPQGKRDKPPPARVLWHTVPADWKPNEKHAELAKELGFTREGYKHQYRQFKSWEFKRPRSDADRAFMNWLTRSAKDRDRDEALAPSHFEKATLPSEGPMPYHQKFEDEGPPEDLIDPSEMAAVLARVLGGGLTRPPESESSDESPT
jgi:hypothetical protein